MPDTKFFSSNPIGALQEEPDDLDTEVSVEPEKDQADANIQVDPETGDVTVDLAPKSVTDDDDSFDENLALKIDDMELGKIANDLLEGIEADEQSRSTWAQDYAKGLSLLGFKLEQPRGDVGTTSSPVDGMSVVRHPLLGEAVLRFNANARGELLPSEGPCKVKVVGDATAEDNQQAEALGDGLNHYLTDTATEYVPDTDQMLMILGYGGLSYKKGYHCPIRRRPVIESVGPKDMIVSETATDLMNAQRVTHRIPTEPSVMHLLQVQGIYRTVKLGPPSQPQQGPIDQKIDRIQGIAPSQTRPQDQPYELFECRCKLVLAADTKVPTDLSKNDVAVPYRVTIEKESRQVLEIRRDWKEDDEHCERKRRIVKYFYAPGFGYYPLGLLHLLGNSANALTASWREMLDAGMFANFPGFLVAKSLTRQNTNEMRVPPGGGVAIDTQGRPISDMVMKLPYQDVTSGLMQLTENIAQTAGRFGGTAEIQVGEGKQDAPVGTTIALIEQATKIESAVHKRMYQSMSEELKMLVELLREDPEAFWRHNKSCKTEWTEAKFLAALDKCNIEPVADPNVPSHLHRIMQAQGVVQLDKAYPGVLNPKWVVTNVLTMMKWNTKDPDMWAPPAQPQMDPRVAAVIQKAKDTDAKNQIEMAKLHQEAQQMVAEKQLELMKLQGDAQDRASQERQATIKFQVELLQLAEKLAVHSEAAPLIGNMLANPAVSGPNGTHQ